jgi:hypothetical protein
MSAKVVFGLIALMFAAMLVLYINLSGNVLIGVVAASVMIVVGFSSPPSLAASSA